MSSYARPMQMPQPCWGVYKWWEDTYIWISGNFLQSKFYQSRMLKEKTNKFYVEQKAYRVRGTLLKCAVHDYISP